MILIAHIISATLSVITSSVLFARPSSWVIKANYAFFALTFASGTYIVLNSHVQMLETCLTGLVYTAFVVASMAFAKHSLSKAAKA